MPHLARKHSLSTRLLHWLSVPVLAVMVWSGVAISGAKAPYTVEMGGVTLLTLFPRAFFHELEMEDLARAIGWHLSFALLMVPIGLVYLGWTLASGAWRSIVPKRSTFGDAARVVVCDLFGRSLPPKDGKYNSAQRLAYTIAIAICGGLLMTGLAVQRPTQLSFLVWLLGGYPWARAEHFWLTIFLVGFVAIHVLQVARAGWNTLRAMIIGVEVQEDAPGKPEACATHVEA